MTRGSLRVLTSLTLVAGFASAKDQIGSPDPRDLPEVRALVEFLPQLKKLDEAAENALFVRRRFVPALAIDESFGDDVTTEQLQEVLQRHEEYIESLIDLSLRLPAHAPPEVDWEFSLSLAELEDAHLDLLDARVLNSVRLLQADAVRAWEAESWDACAERIAAAFEFSRFIISPDGAHQRTPSRIGLITSVLELETLANAGLLDEVSRDSLEWLRSAVPLDESDYMPDASLLPRGMPRQEPTALRRALAVMQDHLRRKGNEDP